MKNLSRASDALFLLAMVLLVIALVATIKLLVNIALGVLAASVVLVIVKRRRIKARRQT